MTSVVAGYNDNVLFWDANPQFKVLGDFADLYKKDRTKGKQYSSKVMWAVVFFADLDKENKFRSFPEDERKSLIKKEFVNDNRFKWEEVQYLVDFYLLTQMSQQKRSLIMLRKKMEEREAFLAIVKYSLKNAKELDTIIANTDKLFSLMDKLEDQIKKAEDAEGGQVRGGRIESASELKKI